MQVIDPVTGARGFQVMVAMRDGTRLNTFVFLPGSGGPRWSVILHRTPYGITTADARDKTDCTKAWLPSAEEPLRGSILRGWRHDDIRRGIDTASEPARLFCPGGRFEHLRRRSV